MYIYTFIGDLSRQPFVNGINFESKTKLVLHT